MKRRRGWLDWYDADGGLPECMPWVVFYLIASALVMGIWPWLAVALLVNAGVSLICGMIARGMGKQETPVVLLGLLLGPLGALAGMVAARQR